MIQPVLPHTTELNRVPRREGYLAAAFLFALVTAVHYDVLFLGRSLVLTNLHNPLDFRPLPQNYGDNLVPAEEWTSRFVFPYANIRDPGATWWQWEPSSEFFRQGLHRGEWPFWDPYVAAGTTAMANLIPAFFFPPHLAVTVLGGAMPLKNAYFLFLLWGAGFTSFLFLRRHGLSFLASLSGATVVLMSGPLNQNLGSFMGQTAACLPPTLYATRLFLDRPNHRRMLVLALTYAAASLASFPPLVVAVFGTTASYALASIAMQEGPANRAQSLGRWAAATLMSVGLVGFYYLPALVLRQAAPQVAAIYHNAALGSIPLVNGLQVLSPTLMGGVQVYLSMPFAAPGTPHIPYIGMAAAMAVLLARPAPGRRGRILFVASAAAAIAIALKLFGIPPVQWVARLPFLREIHFADYFGVPLGFTLAFLAALGFDSMIRRTITIPRALVAAGAAVVAAACLWWIAWTGGRFQSLAAINWLRDWRFLVVVTLTSSAAVLCSATARRRAWVAPTMAAILLGAIAVEGVFNNSYPSPSAWNMFEHPVPYMEVLQAEADMERVLGFGAPNPNVNEAFGVFSLGSLMPFNPPRVYDLFWRYTRPRTLAPVEIFMREPSQIPPEPVLDRANISFLGVRRDLPDVVKAAETRGYRVRFDDGYVMLFERQTLPRFFFSSEYRVLPAPAALDAVASVPSREIVLEEQPPFAPTPNLPGDPAVRVEAYRRNSVTLTVDAPRTGFLYASESFFDGWTARVNGRAARILPANYAFRAVAVPPGTSRVEFRYWPPGLTAGLALSGGGALALAMSTFWWPGPRRDDAYR
jgi:hypothetical protein